MRSQVLCRAITEVPVGNDRCGTDPIRGMSQMTIPLLAALVLERDPKLGPVGDRVPIADVEILLDHLSNSELSEALACEPHCACCSILPRLITRADQLDHFVHAHDNIASSGCPPWARARESAGVRGSLLKDATPVEPCGARTLRIAQMDA